MMEYTIEWLPEWGGYMLIVKEEGKEFSRLLSSREQLSKSLEDAKNYFKKIDERTK